jgi:transposase
MATGLDLIDQLGAQIDAVGDELAAMGADHSYVQLLTTVPGVGWVFGYTIASEIGDISHFYPEEVGRLHRPVPARLSVRRQGLPRMAYFRPSDTF